MVAGPEGEIENEDRITKLHSLLQGLDYATIANIDLAYNEINPSGKGLINSRGLNINS